jgi:hypothetical protein
MPSVDDFAKANPSLNRTEAAAAPSADQLSLVVEIIEVLPDVVNFAYAGIGYSVARSRVSDISVVTDPHSIGDLPSPPHAIMTISHDAKLTTTHSIAAADLVTSVPFSMMGPSGPTAQSMGPTERESQWMLKTRYQTLASDDGYAFPSNSASRSGGRYDDSSMDDWCHTM